MGSRLAAPPRSQQEPHLFACSATTPSPATGDASLQHRHSHDGASLQHPPATGDISLQRKRRCGGAPSQHLDDRRMLQCSAVMFRCSSDAGAAVLHRSTLTAAACFTAAPRAAVLHRKHRLPSHLHRSTRWLPAKLYYSATTARGGAPAQHRLTPVIAPSQHPQRAGGFTAALPLQQPA